MNPFFIRLALMGSGRAWGRPAGIVAGIAVGAAILLLLVGAFQALDIREARSAWLNTAGVMLDLAEPAPELVAGQALIANRTDFFDERPITRIDIAASRDGAINVPGIGAAPAPGTYYVSPALAKAIDQTPNDQLGARFGDRVGLIDRTALPSPDARIVVVGMTALEVEATGRAELITGFAGQPTSNSTVYKIVLGIGAVGLFFPVILFVSIVTRLGAAERQERFSTLRLLGASPRQVAVLAGAEMFVVSMLGSCVGALLATALRPVAARIEVNGGAFYSEDLGFSIGTFLGVAAAIVLVATAVTMIGILRSGISPLGVTRQRRERAPRKWRLLVLLLGLAALAVPRFAIAGDLPGAIISLLMIGGFFFTSLGLVLVGPWLTYRLSSGYSLLARSAASVIASSRIRATPSATFRAVSGLVVAVFMVSVFASAAGSVMTATAVDASAGRLPANALYAALPKPDGATNVAAAASAVPGVLRIILGYDDSGFALGAGTDSTCHGSCGIISAADAPLFGLSVPLGAAYVAFDRSELQTSGTSNVSAGVAATLAPGMALPMPRFIVAITDGSLAAIEGVRTAIEVISSATAFPKSRLEERTLGAREVMRELAFVAYLGAFISIAIAGFSLAIATASAMIDRKRVFGLLRLMGMPASELRRIVSLEAAVPLIAVLALSIALGLFVAWLILGTLAAEIPFTWPEPPFFVTLAVGLAVALGTVASTFGLIRRDTAIGTTRFE